MKSISTLALLCLSYAAAFSQCMPPEVLNWQFSTPDHVTIIADFPEGTTAYELTFVSLYANANPLFSDTLVYTNAASPGIASLEHDPTNMQIYLDPATYYYEALLRVQCGGAEWSAPHRFYVSPLSLLNMAGTSCNIPFTAIQFLPDGVASIAYAIEVPEGDSAVFVEDVSILVDIGHTFNGDLSISLTSPMGTTVQLLAFPNGFTGTTGLSMFFSDGAEAISGPVGVFAPVEPLSVFNGEMAQGTWVLSITDNLFVDFGFLFGGCININSSPCVSSIAGKVFYDFNANGLQDANEPPYAHALLENTLDGSMFFSNSSGTFARCVDEGPVSLSLANTPLYYTSSPAVQSAVVETGDAVTGLNFALLPEGTVVDLHADMFSFGFDRPGFSNSYAITCTNMGNTCVDAVSLEVVLDPLLSITEVEGGSSAAFSANTATVQIGTLCPLQSVEVQVFHNLPDTVSLGTVLQSTATLFPEEDDANIINNTSQLNSIVVGAFDPNDKQVNAVEINADFMDNEKYLYYHVRFQNTGTFYAEFVVISDTIDDLLDFSTFELLEASHAVELSNEERMIDFTFNSIFLPDSASDLEGSQGFVRYRIKPLPEFALGDTIFNTAHIFFDFNEAIVTNTVTTVWGNALGIHGDAIVPGLFPNPTSRELHVQSPGLSKARSYNVSNLMGKRVKVGTISGGQSSFSISVEDLSPGLYLLQIEGEASFKPVKWMKL